MTVPEMAAHQDWQTAAFGMSAVAESVGPFPGRDWLRTWWEERGHGELLIAESRDSLAVLTIDDSIIEFAGEADLTDYHSPLGAASVAALVDLVTGLPNGISLQLDSLPAAASVAVAGALVAAGLSPTVRQHKVAAVLDLPDSFDGYLAAISKKERHEMRRKRRRFDNERGPATLVRQEGPEAVALFADLHRRSAGDKGAFMSSDMERFFLALHTNAGGFLDVLVDGLGLPAAAVFSFEDDKTSYLYNSAFEPDIGHLSPGNVVLSHLIETAIAAGRTVFDFLKGAETYKFRLGARARPLYEVTATTGTTP